MRQKILKTNRLRGIKRPKIKNNAVLNDGTISEIALLNEEDKIIATWDMFEKISLVIGKDIRENRDKRRQDMLVIIGQYAEGTEQIDDRHKRYQLLGNLRYTLDSPDHDQSQQDR